LIFLVGPASQAQLSGLGEVVAGFRDPSVEGAKSVLSALDDLIENGDARTVTLAKKVHRSIKRIFTIEYKVLAGKKAMLQREARARQLDRNAREWMKPNVHGDVNRSAAAVATRKAMALRSESQDARAGLSKAWAEEAADFEKMLGDLEFSRESQSIEVLGRVLLAIVNRMTWVARPVLRYDEARISFLGERIRNSERWITLAKHAAAAGNLDLAYDLYRRAGSDLAKFQVGVRLANRLTKDGFTGSAQNFWERIGEENKANELRAAEPTPGAGKFRKLTGAALARHASPACVRVLVPGGHRTAFFYQQGGYLLTCKSGLLDKEGKPLPLTVVLEDGRKFSATMLGFSAGYDLAALKIACNGHELLSLGDRADRKPGEKAALFGFPKSVGSTATSVEGTVMLALENWKNQPVTQLAFDGNEGQRGGPVVDQRGRVMGVFIFSKTGTARALDIGVVKEFVKRL
jgi:S1-C subfamily serine protease